jgi:hypothetical protein
MIIARTIAVFCLAASLAACGQQTASQAQTSAPAPAAAQTGKPDVSITPAQATAPSSGVTAAALVGRWGDNGDCTKDIVFDANGTFRSYTGGSGTWSLNGDMITMSGSGGTFTLRVQSLNDHQLLIGNPDGSIGTSQRC